MDYYEVSATTIAFQTIIIQLMQVKQAKVAGCGN